MKKILFIALLTLTPLFSYADATSTASTSSPQAVTITIRSTTGEFSGVVDLAASTTPPVDISPTGSTSTISVAADSLLATLVSLDATTADFDITDLAYFPSFGSFIINCIAIPSGAAPECFNWTYAVNGNFPFVGIDDYILQADDVVHLFFGPQRKTIISTSTAAVGEPFTATALSYDLGSGTYIGAPGLTLGVGTPNPDFSFTEIATSTSNQSGEVIFTLNATGTFAVGIKEDFYFPNVSITIVASSTDATSTPPTAPPSDGGGGGGGGISHGTLNLITAVAYLTSKQQADGSFGASLFTDWAAIALSSVESGDAKIKLKNYLLTALPTLTSITDFERHAMALEALGINPYSGGATDYITPIVAAFDGNQIGDSALYNDDIFALFPLLHAGYTSSDVIIQKTAAFIISKQNPTGSWGDPDMTAAAIQALGPLFDIPGTNAALSNASSYLKSIQQGDGGWSTIDSTSWVKTALNAINEAHPTPESAWASAAGYFPSDSIASAQQSDGAVRPTTDSVDNRVWSTSYAITAASGKSWITILQSFAKPTITSSNAGGTGGGAVFGSSTSTAATSTPVVATSTPVVATSTPPVATSTPLVLGESTSTAAIENTQVPPPAPKPKPKPKVVTTKKPTPTPQLADQTPAPTPSSPESAATATDNPGFLKKIWAAIASFFSKLF